MRLPAVRAAARGRQAWRRKHAVGRRLQLMSRGGSPLPEPLPPVEPTAVLQDDSQWQDAVRLARERRLPLHHDLPKNWDTAGAAATVLARVGPMRRVLDAGAARYSTLLVWLYRYGLRRLVGINLEFRRPIRHGRGGCVLFAPGDATATGFDAGSFDAITCLSVIEHGVPIDAFLAESARLLRAGRRAGDFDRLRRRAARHDRAASRTARLCTSSRPTRYDALISVGRRSRVRPRRHLRATALAPTGAMEAVRPSATPSCGSRSFGADRRDRHGHRLALCVRNRSHDRRGFGAAGRGRPTCARTERRRR